MILALAPWIHRRLEFDPFYTYTFQCIANYLLTAINAVSANYFCEASGAWNTTFTPCTGSKQIILDQTTAANLLSSFSNLFRLFRLWQTANSSLEPHRRTHSNRPIAGSIAIYTCDPGFTLIGSNTSTCSSNGTWSTPEPFCSCKQFIC